MKYVHSIWSKPATTNNFDNAYDVKYLSKNFYSYLLSALLIKRLGYEIELYCDEASKEMYSMIPYEKINLVDYEADRIDSKFWIWGKIKTHLLINQPYIHIDGDVFLFRDVVGNRFNEPVIIQSFENSTTIGNGFNNVYLKSSTPFPNGKYGIDWNKYNYVAYNCGVVGFNDIRFKNLYANKVKEILIDLSNDSSFSDNRKKYDGMFLIAEQSLLYYLINEQNIKPFEIIPYKKIVQRNYDWYRIANEIGYCHMWGYSKYRTDVIDKIKFKINKYFPQHSKIINEFELKYM